MRRFFGPSLAAILVFGMAFSAHGQTAPTAQEVVDGINTARDTVNTVKDAAGAVTNIPANGVDAGADLAKKALPPELAPVVDTAAGLGKALVNVADGKVIADAVGNALDKFGGVMADILGSGKELQARVDRLEKENTEKMIEIEHSKASLARLEAKLDQTNTVLTELIEAHNKRINELEAKVARLEAEKGIIKAPFKVLGQGGAAVLTVSPDGKSLFTGPSGEGNVLISSGGDGAAISATSPRGGFSASIGESGAKLQVSDTGSNATVALIAGDETEVRVSDSGRTAELGVDDNLFGLKLAEGEKLAASLGTLPGKGIALRLFNEAGNQVVSAGANPAKGGAGLIAAGVPDGGKSAAVMEAQEDGSGLIQANAPDGTGAAALVGKERTVAAYNKSGAPVATIGQSDKSEGGTVVARNPSGEGIFAAGYAAGYGGGEACVWREKRSNTFCLGLGLPGMGVGK